MHFTRKSALPVQWLALLTTLATALAQPASPQASEPLLQPANLVYQGAFRVPEGSTNQTSFSYGGTALTYNPINNSLYLTGHDWYQLSAEISIPPIVISTSIGALATATLMQPFADATEGTLNSINPADPNPKKIGGHLVHDGKLIVTGFSFYDGKGTQFASHFVRPLSLSARGQVKGPFKVGAMYPGFVSGYMTPVPSEWQSVLGGPVLTGNCCLNIISWQSSGPAASVFDPSRLGAMNPVSATLLVGYRYPNALGAGDTTQNSYFNLTTKITGVVFPGGTRSVLFFGRHGAGKYCYGSGTSDQVLAATAGHCYDPADSSKGTHAYPYLYQVWAYDANELVAVKNGSKLPYQLQPYAVWTFNLPFENARDRHLLGGTGYDPQTNRIYISQRCEDSNCGPIVQVFKVDGIANSTDKPAGTVEPR